MIICDSMVLGTSETVKFSDLGAEIAKCNITPKVEVSIDRQLALSI